MNEVLIIGDGPLASEIADLLAQRQIPSAIATTAPHQTVSPGDGNTVPSSSRLVHLVLKSCRCEEDGLSVSFSSNSRPETRRFGAVVLAFETETLSHLGCCGLPSSACAFALQDAESALSRDCLPDGSPLAGVRLALFNGFETDSQPSVARRMLSLSLALAQKGARPFFFTGNLKFDGHDSELLSRHAQDAGVFFVKFNRRRPRLDAGPNGKTLVEYRDNAARMDVRLLADAVIVDETRMPDAHFAKVASALQLEQDQAGFAQADNVHRLSHLTNRNGIFVAGGGRQAEFSDAEAQRVTLQVAAYLSGETRTDGPAAVINTSLCARCLNCVRFCPHQAVQVGTYMSIDARACRGCGICVAGCPARAISLASIAAIEDDGGIEKAIQPHPDTDQWQPKLVVFGCQRSAQRAAQMAPCLGYPLPFGMVTLSGPCGGSIGVQQIMKAFEQQADGVVVVTCHEDNCQSTTGSRWAKRRTEQASVLLKQAGVSADRLMFLTLASNMGAELARQLTGFQDRIRALGPSAEA